MTSGAGTGQVATRRALRLLHDALHHIGAAALALTEHPSQADVAEALDGLARVRTELARLEATTAEAMAAAPGAGVPPALERRVQLEPSAKSAQVARQVCQEACDEWGLPAEITSSAKDISSELVANAARLARSPVTLSIERSPHRLLIRVWDDAAGRPHLLPYRAGVSERGIGLRLVKQLSRDWGWTPEQDGKWVWAQLAVPDVDTRALAPRRHNGPPRRPP